MELSEGFLQFEKKTHTTHNEKNSLLISENMITKVYNIPFP